MAEGILAKLLRPLRRRGEQSRAPRVQAGERAPLVAAEVTAVIPGGAPSAGAQEDDASRRDAPIEVLDLPHRLRDALVRAGVTTVGQALDLGNDVLLGLVAPVAPDGELPGKTHTCQDPAALQPTAADVDGPRGRSHSVGLAAHVTPECQLGAVVDPLAPPGGPAATTPEGPHPSAGGADTAGAEPVPERVPVRPQGAAVEAPPRDGPLSLLRLSPETLQLLTDWTRIGTISELEAKSDEALLLIPFFRERHLAEVRHRVAAFRRGEMACTGELALPDVTPEAPEYGGHAGDPRDVEQIGGAAPHADETAAATETPVAGHGTPIRVLGLSTRSHNCLVRAGLETVESVEATDDMHLFSLRGFGRTSLAEVRGRIAAFRRGELAPSVGAAATSPDDRGAAPHADETAAATETPVAGRGTPLRVLGLSTRSYNCLVHAGLETVESVEATDDMHLFSLRGCGRTSLAEVRGRIAAFRRGELALSVGAAATSPDDRGAAPIGAGEVTAYSLSVRLGDGAMLERLSGAPLASISLHRLALTEEAAATVRRRGGHTVADVAALPDEERWHNLGVATQLTRYLEWLAEEETSSWRAEVDAIGANPLQAMALRETTLERIMEFWFSVLDPRLADILVWHYGLHGDEETLETIAGRRRVTRERVRQLELKAVRALSRWRPPLVWAVLAVLQGALRARGGLATTAELVEALTVSLSSGAVDVAGAIRLLFRVDEGARCLSRLGVWAVPAISVELVRSAQEMIEGLLSRDPEGLSLEELHRRLAESQLRDTLPEGLTAPFVESCLRLSRASRRGESGRWFGRAMRPRAQQVYDALQRLGRPSHYTAIAAEVNARLPQSEWIPVRSIHAVLCAEPEHFAWIGKKGVFGLCAWGLKDLPKHGRGVIGMQSRELARVLRQASRPLTAAELVEGANRGLASDQRLTEDRACAILDAESATFARVGDGYVLTEWAAGADSGDGAGPRWNGSGSPRRPRGIAGHYCAAMEEALRAIGRPATVEEVLAKANERLERHRQLDWLQARELLDRYPSLFTAVDGRYALAEAEAQTGVGTDATLPLVGTVRAAPVHLVVQLLELAGCPLTAAQIAEQLPLLGADADEAAVATSLRSPRFRPLGDGRYDLAR